MHANAKANFCSGAFGNSIRGADLSGAFTVNA